MLPKDQCDLATIYRSMHLLEKMGMVKRFDFGDGAARFELIGEDDDGHHHHLVCTRCSESCGDRGMFSNRGRATDCVGKRLQGRDT